VKVFVRLYLKPTFLGNMADDLSKMWETFTLTKSEDLEFDIPRGEFREVVPRGQVCIVGKLISKQMVIMEALKASLIRLWKPSGNLSFKVLGENLFLIDFVELGAKNEFWQGDRGSLKEACSLLKILMERFRLQNTLSLRLLSGCGW
jgi:hypothetical protein